MERLLTVLIAMCLLFVLVYFVTEVREEPPVEPIVDVAASIEEEDEIPTVEEVPEEPTTLKSFFKEEETEGFLQKLNKEVSKLGADLSVSVVSVVTERDLSNAEHTDELHELLMESVPQHSTHSGTVVDANGYILTTYQAVYHAKDIKVFFSTGTRKDAKIVGVDPYTNLAVIKVEVDTLTPVTWADSKDLNIGQFALNLCMSHDNKSTLRRGIISSLKRSRLIDNGVNYENFIKLDYASYVAGSGSPVVNIAGEVIAIQMQLKSENVVNQSSYAVVSNLARFVADSIINNGYVKRARIGVRVQSLNNDLAHALSLDRTTGALVADVFQNSPAEQAAMMAGDVIIKIDDTKIDTDMDLRLKVARLPLDTMVQFDVVRNGELVSIPVTAESQVVPDWRNHYGEILDTHFTDAVEVDVSDRTLEGITVATLTESLATRYSISLSEESTGGMVITNVKNGTIEKDAGLKNGMLIIEIDRNPVTTTDEYKLAVESVSEKKNILLLVEEAGLRKFIVVKK